MLAGNYFSGYKIIWESWIFINNFFDKYILGSKMLVHRIELNDWFGRVVDCVQSTHMVVPQTDGV